MKISILCTDGSPLGVTSKTIYGDRNRVGVGGSELALLTMCEEWSKRGDEVILYNDPWEQCSMFEQRPVRSYSPKDKTDVLIIFRSPNLRGLVSDGYKVWWSCDQRTIGNFREFGRNVSKIVTISPYHQNYFKMNYGLDSIVTDLPIRKQDFSANVEKLNKNKFIYTSVPDRGLDVLWRIWPIITQRIPNAELVITSDYRLWGASESNDRYKIRWVVRQNFKFLGALPRMRMIQELETSSMLLYPCIYDELFCYSVAEAQYAGTYPITSSIGALRTTNMGTVLDWDVRNPTMDASFVESVLMHLDDTNFENTRIKNIENARNRFDPEVILEHWDRNIFGGL